MSQISRHQCLIYEDYPSQHIRSLALTIAANLSANNRCLYLNSPAMVAGMRSVLAANGLDLCGEIEKGALILTSDQSHLQDGKFDVERMLNMLKSAVQQACDAGYDGLWASGDISWEFGNETNIDKLLEYEQRLDQFLKETIALSGVCQYHRKTLPSHAIQTALRSHKAIYVNETLCRLNLHYEAEAV